LPQSPPSAAPSSFSRSRRVPGRATTAATASDVSGLLLLDDGNLAAAGIVPMQKNDSNVFIDLTTDTLLPNAYRASAKDLAGYVEPKGWFGRLPWWRPWW
jgi:hypothetical protein